MGELDIGMGGRGQLPSPWKVSQSGLVSPISTDDFGQAVLESIANSTGEFGDVERMLDENSGAKARLISVSEFIAEKGNGKTETLLSAVWNFLEGQAKEYISITDEKQRSKFYQDLVGYLGWVYTDFKRGELPKDLKGNPVTTLKALDTLNLAIKFRDSYLEIYDHLHDHMRSSGYRAERIAEIIGLPEGSKTLVKAAAKIHDVGKIRMPIYLFRCGKYRADVQKEIMARHANEGVILLERILPEDMYGEQIVIEIVRKHHEKSDGELLRDIVMGAEQSDAIVSRRSYHPGEKGESKQFTPEEVKEQLGINLKKRLLSKEIYDILVSHPEFLRPGLGRNHSHAEACVETSPLFFT